jgi:hypothetical protein
VEAGNNAARRKRLDLLRRTQELQESLLHSAELRTSDLEEYQRALEGFYKTVAARTLTRPTRGGAGREGARSGSHVWRLKR